MNLHESEKIAGILRGMGYEETPTINDADIILFNTCCIRENAEKLGVDPDFYSNSDIHIHVPEGAVPKDGPSAGVTITTALVSVLTGKPVRRDVAMTGEITLRGKLLPVGGIKEKILAAKRAGIKEIILCVDNQKDVNEIQQEYLDGLKFHFVRNMADALAIAIEK